MAAGLVCSRRRTAAWPGRPVRTVPPVHAGTGKNAHRGLGAVGGVGSDCSCGCRSRCCCSVSPHALSLSRRFGVFTAPDGGLAGPDRFGPFRQCMPALEKMLTVVLVLLVVQ